MASTTHQPAGTQIAIPPQPNPSVQETTFAADANSELQVLDHEPIPDNDTTTNNENPTLSFAHPPPSQARSIPPDLLRGLLMVLMALDHNVMALQSWPHSTAVDGEVDSLAVHVWNRPIAYVIRTMTHLCAPGFTFLLGMGVVYFGRSRTNLGWGAGRMVWHFAVRGVVLTGLTVAMGLLMTGGKIWFFNIVLFMLAVDYFVAGVGWLVLSRTEGMVAFLLLRVLPEGKGKGKGDEREPLLGKRGDSEVEGGVASDGRIVRAADVSWHLHNGVLMVLAVVTIWWNVWLSPNGGYCSLEENFSRVKSWEIPESPWLRIWFWTVGTPRVLSGFPPFAWLSFAVLGLLYGRVILARSWSAKAITAGNALAGVVFSMVFVSTRLFHWGNLSEGCLQMPEHTANPTGNQYLASPPSFFYLIKYPPDVAFWAFTMAVNFFLMAIFSIIPSHFSARVFKILLVFGTSALFFYTTHIFLLFALAAVVIPLLGHEMPFNDVLTGKPATGVDQLWAFFLNWAVALAILYPLCRWYGRFKKTKGPDSIWRFF